MEDWSPWTISSNPFKLSAILPSLHAHSRLGLYESKCELERSRQREAHRRPRHGEQVRWKRRLYSVCIWRGRSPEIGFYDVLAESYAAALPTKLGSCRRDAQERHCNMTQLIDDLLRVRLRGVCRAVV